MVIYLAHNTINNKLYIGKTTSTLDKRIYSHKRAAQKGVKTVFHCAIRKYGFDSFKFSTIGYCINKEDLNKLEKFFIALHGSKIPDGYNLTDGGDGNDGTIKPNLGIHLSDETKEKIRRANLGKKQSKETIGKRSESLKLAYREGRRKSLRGMPSPLKGRRGNPAWNKGMKGFLKGRTTWNKKITQEVTA